jgi:hypothetical protein
MDVWDRFPHLCISSPEKRCGKTTLLDLLFSVVPRPRYTTNISPAALYRVVELEEPTLLMDESQSLSRRGSETSEVVRELLNAGIGKNAKVLRCGGLRHDQIEEFSVYSPKVFAMIGPPDSVLADRSLPVELKRKTADDRVLRFRSRVVEPRGQELHEALEQWAEVNKIRVQEVFDDLEPFSIQNDRMAELLLPLQAVLIVAEADRSDGVDGISEVCEGPLDLLREYAESLDERDKEQEMQTPGVRLLAACQELFTPGVTFLPTATLINDLVSRREEPWWRWNKGEPITDEALANLLRPYGIRPSRNTKQTARGYHAVDFEEAWSRYLPAPQASKSPPKPTIPATKAGLPSDPSKSLAQALNRAAQQTMAEQ